MTRNVLQEAKDRVERALASSPLATESKSRALTYDRIFDALERAWRRKLGDNTTPQEILCSILDETVRAIQTKDQQAHERAEDPLTNRYWRERERLEKEIRSVSLSPLVMPFTHLIKFRSVESVFCEHDRYRESCVWIRQQLERLRAVPSDARTRRFLTALGLNPEKTQLDEFCKPPSMPKIVAELVAESQTPPRPTRRSRGRRSVNPVLDEFIVKSATILERRGGLSHVASVGFAGDLVVVCFGAEVNTESILRQARRRRERARNAKSRPKRTK